MDQLFELIIPNFLIFEFIIDGLVQLQKKIYKFDLQQGTENSHEKFF